jgi:putative copper resistance protein D
VHRFSSMGLLSVAALILSGIVNSLFQVDGFVPLLTTLYGRILLIKLALFVGMLVFAAANRVRLWPRLAQDSDHAEPWLDQLKRNVTAEQILGVLVLAAVAYLGTQEPAHLQAE